MIPPLHRSLWTIARQLSPFGLMTLSLLNFASLPSGANPASDLPLEAEQTAQFYSVPRLIYTGTNRDQANASWPTYYFTLTFPASEGAALGRVDLVQIEGSPIALVPDQTIAFVGTHRDRGEDIPLTVQTLADEEQTGIRITFPEAITPDQTITLAVRARSNPYQDGVYLYALVAYPEGKPTDGYTLGIGRLHFYENNYFRL
ncbi:MAG: DUF2808 domain-containing protein [Prochlorotrichaceae cyanobacterium]|jgi:hypothetical protein